MMSFLRKWNEPSAEQVRAQYRDAALHERMNELEARISSIETALIVVAVLTVIVLWSHSNVSAE